MTIRSIAFLFCFLLAIVGCRKAKAPAGPDKTTGEKGDSSYKILKDSFNGYQLKYPATWIAQKMPKSKNLIKASVMKDKKTGFQVRIYENIKMDFASFFKWFSQKFQKDMIGHWGGEMKVLEKRVGEEKGRKIALLTLDFKRSDGQRWFFAEYLWKKGDDVLLLQCGTPYGKREKEEPILRQVAESVEFD